MNDFEKKLIELGFIPVDLGIFVNLVESINRNGDKTRFFIKIEKINDKSYKYSENSYEDENFVYFSHSFSLLEIKSFDRFNRLFNYV